MVLNKCFNDNPNEIFKAAYPVFLHSNNKPFSPADGDIYTTKSLYTSMMLSCLDLLQLSSHLIFKSTLTEKVLLTLNDKKAEP